MALLPKLWEESPRLGLMDLRKQMDRLFEDFFRGFDLAPLSGLGEWTPSVDVKETETSVVVQAELPGIEPKDLDVNITGDTLTIKGERQEQKEEKGETYHRIERRYGAFSRSIPLPAEVDPEKVDATYDKGVLTINLSKKKPSPSKSIRIQVK